MKQLLYAAVMGISLLFLARTGDAQVRLEPGKMAYLGNIKPNNIIYRDTLYRGSKEFMALFYRTRDPQLIYLYQRHQSQKITGQVLGIAGSVAMIIGIGRIGSTNQKTLGWILTGGGFASLMTGGYLTVESQKSLLQAVTLFNQKHNKASLGIGVSPATLGFVYRF
ncbi:MAG: hypothetical protein GXC72_04730 [Chitinophagaceae bacterium]|jgi:hypothetical protein|nr:hypothetical protein [Chitinophagaceae bacterium]